MLDISFFRPDANGKITVRYESGEPRNTALFGYDTAVDWMLCILEDADGDEIELYAEVESEDGSEQWTAEQCAASAAYADLKEQITQQAIDHGIDPESLRFWYDS